MVRISVHLFGIGQNFYKSKSYWAKPLRSRWGSHFTAKPWQVYQTFSGDGRQWSNFSGKKQDWSKVLLGVGGVSGKNLSNFLQNWTCFLQAWAGLVKISLEVEGLVKLSTGVGRISQTFTWIFLTSLLNSFSLYHLSFFCTLTFFI